MQYTLRLPLPALILGALTILFIAPQVSAAAEVTVVMGTSTYSPKNITITAGDTITWVNNSPMSHTVSADSNLFDSGIIQTGQSFSAKFTSPGTYPYYCKLHGGVGGVGMAGVLTVVAAPTPVVVGGNTVTNTNTNINTNTNTSAVTQLQAQLQALLNQINALQGQTGGGVVVQPSVSATYDSSSCPLVGRSLKRGSSGDDVTRLQQFLARDASVYPEGTVSGYYGALTEKAVQRWQVKYHIVSSGTPETTGYGVVGPRTAAAISILCTTGSYAGVAGPSGPSAPVGGYITITPIAGAAPLSVNVTATVNTTNSCANTTYILDFGDGTVPQQITSGGGNCGQSSQTFTHVYISAGTYQIKLSAGAHSTTATVVVSGGSTPGITCPTGFQAQVVGGTSVCVQATTNTSFTYSAPVVSSSGDAYTFTLQFDLPSSCTGYNVDWGDNSTHNTQSDGGSSCSQATSVKSIDHTYATASSYTITLKRGATLSHQDDIAVTIVTQ